MPIATAVMNIYITAAGYTGAWLPGQHPGPGISTPGPGGAPVFALHTQEEAALAHLLALHPRLARADRSVQLACLAGERATAALTEEARRQLVVFSGSSRGPAAAWEARHLGYVHSGMLPPATSPETTLGRQASALAAHLGAGQGQGISMTCSSAAYAIANAAAWLRSGMACIALAGGTEAPLTPFTLAQMHALGIYAHHTADDGLPCKPFDTAQNSFVLGEAAAYVLLQTEPGPAPLARLLAIGTAAEVPPSLTGIQPQGTALAAALRQALAQLPAGVLPQAILAHAPGTLQGDRAELNAITAAWPTAELPPVVSVKWFTGHTLGASPAVSLFAGLEVLAGRLPLHSLALPGEVPQGGPLPYEQLRCIAVLSAGFGGNAAAMVVALP